MSTQKNRANEYETQYIIYRMKDQVTTAIGMHIVTMPSLWIYGHARKMWGEMNTPSVNLAVNSEVFFSSGDDLIR